MISLTHADLVKIGSRWLFHSKRMPVVITELAGGYEEVDVLGIGYGGSVLIECKISKSDLKADNKKMTRRFPEYSSGQKRYYLVTKDLEQDVVKIAPEGWGILIATDRRRRPLVLRESDVFETNWKGELFTLVSVLRRMVKVDGHLDTVNARYYTIFPGYGKKRASIGIRKEE